MEFREFKREDYRAAINAGSWRLKDIGLFYVCGRQWNELDAFELDDEGYPMYESVRIFHHHEEKGEWVSDTNTIRVVHKNGEYYDWVKGGAVNKYALETPQDGMALYENILMEVKTTGDTFGVATNCFGNEKTYAFCRPTSEMVPSTLAKSTIYSVTLQFRDGTYSATLQFRDGTIVEIPEPGEGWECVKEDAMDPWNPTFCSGLPGIHHEAGMLIYKEYENRMRTDNPMQLAGKKWQRIVPISHTVVEHYHGHEYRPPEPEYKHADVFPTKRPKKVIG